MLSVVLLGSALTFDCSTRHHVRRTVIVKRVLQTSRSYCYSRKDLRDCKHCIYILPLGLYIIGNFNCVFVSDGASWKLAPLCLFVASCPSTRAGVGNCRNEPEVSLSSSLFVCVPVLCTKYSRSVQRVPLRAA